MTVVTENFAKLAVAFHRSISHKEIIGVVSPDGVGFKHTLRYFAKKLAAREISDPVLVDDLVAKSRGNLSILSRHISRIKRSGI